MSEVKRYDMRVSLGGVESYESPCGDYVDYEDYAALEAKCAALAAENAGLKAICDDRRRFIMNGVQMGYIKVPAAETDPDLETIRIAISPQKPIPATDAFLAEVRAQGVDMAISQAFMDGIPVNRMQFISRMTDFAAKLRKEGD